MKRYLILVQLFLPSPRNTTEIFRILFENAGVSKLLTTTEPPPAVPGILHTCRVDKFVIPELEELLDDTPVPPLNFDVSWEEYRFRPFLHIHSSGSTGIPKLITLKHGSFSAFDAQQFSGNNELGRRYSRKRVFVSFPPFHLAGLLYALAAPVYTDNTAVLPPPVPLSAAVCNTVHVNGSVELSCIPPSLVTDLVKNEEYLTNLYRLKGLAFAGGPLSDSIGNILSSQIDLLSGIGASEWLTLPMEPKDRADWAWFKWNCKEGGLELRERDEGLYELVIVRKREADLSQPVFVNFPDLDEFETKDLFIKHPSKPDLWKYASRLDDILVFSNGEKVNPVTMEGTITACPALKGCLIVGQGRFQAAAILEPNDPEMARDEIISAAWPFVQQANSKTVQHGRIQKRLIILTQKSKPLPRAAKGTVQRAAANKLYLSEIEELYHSLDSSGSNEKTQLLDLHDLEASKSSLATFLRDELDMGELGRQEDFFAHGMDSLQLINLVRAINATRRENPVEAKQVYDHPSIDKLAYYLQNQVDDDSLADDLSDNDEDLQESWLVMDQMFDDMTATLVPGKGAPKRRHNPWAKNEDMGPVIQPDGGFVAWAQILGSFLINVNNWGLVNTFGVFQAFYETDFLRDLSPSTISWVGTLQGSLLLIVGVVSGPLFDGGYFKFVLVGASLGLVFALMMLSLATQYYQVLLTQGILLGVCSGLLYIPSVALVPVYFKHRRGLALGLATGGGSIGGIIYPIIFRRLLTELGFGWATRVIGFIALVTLGIAIAIIRPLGRRTRRQLLDLDAFRSTPYVSFLITGFRKSPAQKSLLPNSPRTQNPPLTFSSSQSSSPPSSSPSSSAPPSPLPPYPPRPTHPSTSSPSSTPRSSWAGCCQPGTRTDDTTPSSGRRPYSCSLKWVPASWASPGRQ